VHDLAESDLLGDPLSDESIHHTWTTGFAPSAFGEFQDVLV
jgi:hypothetical protein